MKHTPAPSHELLFSLGFWLSLGQNPNASYLQTATSSEIPLAISQDNISIYNKIIYAISMSILFFLAGTDYYIPLSSNVFLGPRPVEDHILSHDAEWRDSSDPFDTFCLEVEWLPCGTLLIYSYPDPGVLRHNLVEVRSTHERYPEFEFQLAPFGTVATHHYQDPRDNELVEPMDETIELDEESRLQSLQPSVSWLLEQHGLQLSDHCEWLRVNIRSPVNDPSSKRSGILTSGTIPWPAHLCFYEDNLTTSGMDSPSWLWPGLEKGASDPLKAAETWFLEKDTREKAMKQKRAEIDANLRLKRQDIQSDNNEFLSTGFLTIDRHIDIQGANGIYPTPPDGFQTQPLGHGSDREQYDQINTHNDTEMLDLVEDKSVVLEQTDQQRALNTEMGMSLGAYGDIEDDDLFDDMDSAMFTAKGITEDDFDFFDEPEELSSYMQSTFDRDPSKMKELEPDPTASQASLAMPTKPTNIDMTPDDVYIAADLEGVSMSQITPSEDKMHVKPEFVRNQNPPQLSPQSITDGIEHHIIPMPIRDLTPPKNTTSQGERTSEEQLSVFGSIPLWEVSQDLDQKYKDCGRFSIDVGIRENDLSLKQDRVERSIPLLGQLARDCTDELDSDEGQQVSFL